MPIHLQPLCDKLDGIPVGLLELERVKIFIFGHEIVDCFAELQCPSYKSMIRFDTSQEIDSENPGNGRLTKHLVGR